MGRASKLPLYLAAMVALGYLGYRALTEPGSQPPGPAQGPAALRPAVRQPGYGLHPANTWPSGEAAAVADNLFAANYYVILDGSGSMNESSCAEGSSKIVVAKTALAAFARSLPQDANLGLAVFDQSGLTERLPLGRDNRDAFSRAVHRVRANADTPLRSALELAYAKLDAQGRRQLGYGEYHLVVVTDGIASPNQDPTEVVNRILAQSPLVLHTIGFCIGEQHSLNQPGRTYYRSANNPQALQQGLETVLAEAPSFAVSQFTD